MTYRTATKKDLEAVVKTSLAPEIEKYQEQVRALRVDIAELVKQVRDQQVIISNAIGETAKVRAKLDGHISRVNKMLAQRADP